MEDTPRSKILLFLFSTSSLPVKYMNTGTPLKLHFPLVSTTNSLTPTGTFTRCHINQLSETSSSKPTIHGTGSLVFSENHLYSESLIIRFTLSLHRFPARTSYFSFHQDQTNPNTACSFYFYTFCFRHIRKD